MIPLSGNPLANDGGSFNETAPARKASADQSDVVKVLTNNT
jgi:hypothetical protein